MVKKRKSVVGRVVSDKMQKTVVVEISYTTHEPRYKKYVRRTLRLKAHDETSTCKTGDQVRLIATRPLSAQKRWSVLEVLHRADGVSVMREQ